MQDNEKIAALYILTEQELEIIINERVIDELERLKKDGFTLVESNTTVKGNYVIAAYRFDEFLKELKK